MLSWLFLTQVAYSIYVGGDAWEWGGSNRYVSIAMPLFFLSFCYAAVQVVSQVPDKTLSKTRLPHRYARYGVLAIVLFVSFVNFNALQDPEMRQRWLLIEPPWDVNRNQDKVRVALTLTRMTSPQAKIAVVWAGAIPYFSDRDAIDLLGKNDKRIARGNMRMDVVGANQLTGFYPGHLKWDLAYSIGQLKPDVVTQFWGTESERGYLSGYQAVSMPGSVVYLRGESRNILWDQISVEVRE
jgi:hypothetical protein